MFYNSSFVSFFIFNYQSSPLSMSSVAPTLFFLLFRAAANASAKDACGPPDEPPLLAATGGCVAGSPRTS